MGEILTLAFGQEHKILFFGDRTVLLISVGS